MNKSMFLTLLAGISFFTSIYPHDFTYYKEKTTELLPLLSIDPAKVTFKEVSKAPSIKQRSYHKKTVFINPTDLNTKPLDFALFECAVQAGVTTITGNDWITILHPEPKPSFVTTLSYVLPAACFFYLCPDNNTFMQLASAGVLTWFAFEKDLKKIIDNIYKIYGHTDLIQDKVRGNFSDKQLGIQIHIVEKLLNNEHTASIACAGAITLLLQQEKPNNANVLEQYAQLKAHLGQWAQEHPHAYQKIKEHLVADFVF